MTVTANSFAGLREAWNLTHPDEKIKAPKPARERYVKCRVCGAKMEHIAGTNVYVCHGKAKVPKPTEKNPDAFETKPCTNRYIAAAK